MAWDELFADLSAQLDAGLAAALAGEVDERREALLGEARLADRLRGDVVLGVAGHEPVRGRVGAVGIDWVLLGGDTLVALDHVLWADGQLGAVSSAPRRTDLRHSLRTVRRDRSALTLALSDGSTVHGTIDAVGADHVLLALHPVGEARRAAAVSGQRAVALTAVVVVRRH